MQKNQINKEIRRIEDEIHTLKEYLLSDCCKQCMDIIGRIERYESEVKCLEVQLKTAE